MFSKIGNAQAKVDAPADKVASAGLPAEAIDREALCAELKAREACLQRTIQGTNSIKNPNILEELNELKASLQNAIAELETILRL